MCTISRKRGLKGSRAAVRIQISQYQALGALGRLARLDTRSSVLPAQASSSDVLSNRVASLLIGTRLAPPLLDRLLHEKPPAQMGHACEKPPPMKAVATASQPAPIWQQIQPPKRPARLELMTSSAELIAESQRCCLLSPRRITYRPFRSKRVIGIISPGHRAVAAMLPTTDPEIP